MPFLRASIGLKLILASQGHPCPLKAEIAGSTAMIGSPYHGSREGQGCPKGRAEFAKLIPRSLDASESGRSYQKPQVSRLCGCGAGARAACTPTCAPAALFRQEVVHPQGDPATRPGNWREPRAGQWGGRQRDCPATYPAPRWRPWRPPIWTCPNRGAGRRRWPSGRAMPPKPSPIRKNPTSLRTEITEVTFWSPSTPWL